jgi:hypothetical protein
MSGAPVDGGDKPAEAVAPAAGADAPKPAMKRVRKAATPGDAKGE